MSKGINEYCTQDIECLPVACVDNGLQKQVTKWYSYYRSLSQDVILLIAGATWFRRW